MFNPYDAAYIEPHNVSHAGAISPLQTHIQIPLWVSDLYGARSAHETI
jgi:hypothetical protein